MESIWAQHAQKNAQGKLTSALMPAISRYEQLDDEGRVRVRKLIRSFCHWYTYATLIVHMFDFDLHKEYCYLDYLSRFLKC